MNRFDLALGKLAPPDKADPIVNRVYNRISSYLNYDIDELLLVPMDEYEWPVPESLSHNDGVVFGGAVRDSIADMEIHDVDIMALPSSCKKILEKLYTAGFKKVPYASLDIAAMYNELRTKHIINEPWT